MPWKTLVVKADPDYERLKRDELEYVFSPNREFKSRNSNTRGIYAGDAGGVTGLDLGVTGTGVWRDVATWEDDAPWKD